MPGTRPQIALTFGKRILIVIAILIGAMIAILEFAEGMKDPIRLGLQDYLTKVSGDNPAEISAVEKSELFPEVEISLKGIVIRDKDDAKKTIVSVEHAEITMSFWKTFLGITDYRIFKIEKAEFATGYVFPKKLSLSFAGISDPSPPSSAPYFVFDGNYNDRPLLITAEMQRKGTKNVHYDFASEFPLTFKLGGTEADARFQRNLTNLRFVQTAIVSHGRKVILRTEGVEFDPLHIRFIGDMGGYSLAGELEQSGDDYTLYIVPGSENREFLANLAAFVASVKDDLGLKAKDEHIKIEIRAPDVAQQKASENKEQAAE